MAPCPIDTAWRPQEARKKYEVSLKPPNESEDCRIRRVPGLLECDPSCCAEDLAGLLQLTVPRLQRLFKEQTGDSLSHYLAELRLRDAALLLASPETLIKNIAFSAGYRHPSSFARAFLQRFSEYPMAYRKRIHK
jgi:AraC-like DNA-binding protein